MKTPIKVYVAAEPLEPTVEREPASKPAHSKGKSVDKVNPHPGLGRRMLFRERAEG